MREDVRVLKEKISRLQKDNDRLFKVNTDLLNLCKEHKLTIEKGELEIERLRCAKSLHELTHMNCFDAMELNRLRSEKNAQEVCLKIQEQMKQLRCSCNG